MSSDALQLRQVYTSLSNGLCCCCRRHRRQPQIEVTTVMVALVDALFALIRGE